MPNTDPTWEQLTNGAGLRYLDAVVHEILRLYAPLAMTTRVAAKDDVIPLSSPLTLPNGDVTDRVAVAAGQEVLVPIDFMNTATAFWGADAREFRPERWLTKEGLPRRAQEVQGHRHLLTFVDGHRMCLGRGFALAEFKVRSVFLFCSGWRALIVEPNIARGPILSYTVLSPYALPTTMCADVPGCAWRARQALQLRAARRARDEYRILPRGAPAPARRGRDGRVRAHACAPRRLGRGRSWYGSVLRHARW